MKQKFYMCLLILTVILATSSCVNFQKSGNNPSASNSGDSLNTDQANSKNPEDDTMLQFITNGSSEYRIVNAMTDAGSVSDIRNFVAELEKQTGATLPIVPASQAIAEKEILIGNTLRPESEQVLKTLTSYSAYHVEIIGEKIVVAVYSEAALAEALKVLSQAFVTSDHNISVPKAFTSQADVSGITVSIPFFETQNGISESIYFCGENNFEFCCSQATLKEYQAYTAHLEEQGFTNYSRNQIGDNLFATYLKDGIQVNLFWYEALTRFQMVYGPQGDLPATEPIPSSGEIIPTVTQIGRSGASQSAPGMSFIIQLSDGSFVVIDGGPKDESDMENLLQFLKSNAPNGEKPRITWMITHAHSDHMALANQFLATYYSEIELETVCYNFPDFASVNVPNESKNDSISRASTFRGLINCYYPNTKQIVFHSGQQLFLPGCEIEFLFTHEDLYPREFSYINHTCSAWRIKIDGKSLLILGDCEKTLCRQMAQVYGSSLKSDMMQLSHHGLNGADLALYQLVDPEICFWPIDRIRYETDPRCLGTDSSYSFNAWIRSGNRKHYHASDTATIVFSDLSEIRLEIYKMEEKP